MTLLEGQMNADLVTSTGKPSGYTRIGFTRTSLEQNLACHIYIKITHTHIILHQAIIKKMFYRVIKKSLCI